MALDIGRQAAGAGGAGGPGRRARPTPTRGHRRRRACPDWPWAMQLVRSGLRGLHHRRAVRRGRRHLAGQHLPGQRVRRPLPPLLLLVRPEVRLDPSVRRAARDPRLRRETASSASGSGPTSASAPRSSDATFDEDTGRWRLSVTSSGGRRDRSRPTPWSSPAASSTDPTFPTSRASRSFAGPSWHSARWDHDCRPGRQAGGRGRAAGPAPSSSSRPVAAEAAELTIFQRSPELRGPEEGPGLQRTARRLLDAVLPVGGATGGGST